MQKEIVKYQRSLLATLVFIDGCWFVSNPVLGVQIALESLDSNLVIAITSLSEGRTAEEIIDGLSNYGLYLKEAAHLFDFLREAGLLVPLDAEEPWGTGVQKEEPTEVFRYLSMRRSVKHADYSDSQIYSYDHDLMRGYLAESNAPAVYKHYCDGPQLFLPHPATTVHQSALSKLGELLFWGFGRLRAALFLELLPAMFKAVPSKGARHPFEAYLSVNAHSWLSPGFYHYDVEDHALSRLDEAPIGNVGSKVVLLIHAIYERFQWRYRHSWAYKDLFFDLGHVQATLKLVAKELRLELVSLELPDEMDHLEPLSEECVAAFQLEGL